jgi:hypothetical protein
MKTTTNDGAKAKTRPTVSEEAKTIERLAETFAMEYLTGHYRQLRDDERPSFEQLKVVMLAFASAVRRLR